MVSTGLADALTGIGGEMRQYGGITRGGEAGTGLSGALAATTSAEGR